MTSIFFVNNEGGGYADNLNIADGTTIASFFAAKFPRRQAGEFHIRVNRNTVTPDYVLQTGDKVSITPTKIQGAASIFFVNNEGGGYADNLNIADGTTIASFFAAKFPRRAAGEFHIRVNRNTVTPDYVLQTGDKVSITPTKIQGAGIAA